MKSLALKYIYFVQAFDFIKIGITSDLETRLIHLQTSNVSELKVLGLMIGDHGVERAVQKKFEHLRERGEWFRIDDEIMSFIKLVCFSLDQVSSIEIKNEPPKIDLAPSNVAPIEPIRFYLMKPTDRRRSFSLVKYIRVNGAKKYLPLEADLRSQVATINKKFHSGTISLEAASTKINFLIFKTVRLGS